MGTNGFEVVVPFRAVTYEVYWVHVLSPQWGREFDLSIKYFRR